jgi:hypothetical protein
VLEKNNAALSHGMTNETFGHTGSSSLPLKRAQTSTSQHGVRCLDHVLDMRPSGMCVNEFWAFRAAAPHEMAIMRALKWLGAATYPQHDSFLL